MSGCLFRWLVIHTVSSLLLNHPGYIFGNKLDKLFMINPVSSTKGEEVKISLWRSTRKKDLRTVE